MGIDRYQEGDDPSQPAAAAADRSGEVPSSRDAGRAGDHVPDSSPREPPDDIEDKPAEPRTRNEYADQVTPGDRPPIEDDSPKPRIEERSHPEDEPREAAPPEEQRPGSSSIERQQAEDRPRLSNGLESFDEQSPSPEDSPDPTGPEEARSGESHDENSHTHQLAREIDSGTDVAQDNDRPHPLTDQEWTQHLGEVRDGLDGARREGLRTIQLYTIDGKGQIWTEERDLLHDSIIEDLYAKAKDVPCDFKAIMAGGLGGAGKTTVLTEHAGIDLTQYLMINPDDFKVEMARRGMLPNIEGLSPMEASDLSHEESSYLAKRLARRAESEGKNLIWDITMASQDSTEGRIESLREAGYAQVDGIFVDIPIELSVKRTESRHREGYEKYLSGVDLGGRFVPPEVIRSQGDKEWSSQNRRTFETVKNNFSTWRIYDNSVHDRPAELIDSDSRLEP